MKNTVRKTIRSGVVLAAICLVAGCETTGLSSRDHAGTSYPNYILGMQSSQPRPSAPKLKTPIRLAVAQVGESAPPAKMLEKLKNQPGVISSVIGLPLPGVANENYYGRSSDQKERPEDFAAKLKTVCAVAQSVGADYLFLFGGNVDAWQDRNELAFLDFTIVGGAVVPSAKIHCESKAAGVLIETATGQPVLFANVEGKRSGLSPSYLADGKTNTLRALLRDEMTAALAEELPRRLMAQIAAENK